MFFFNASKRVILGGPKNDATAWGNCVSLLTSSKRLNQFCVNFGIGLRPRRFAPNTLFYTR